MSAEGWPVPATLVCLGCGLEMRLDGGPRLPNQLMQQGDTVTCYGCGAVQELVEDGFRKLTVEQVERAVAAQKRAGRWLGD